MKTCTVNTKAYYSHTVLWDKAGTKYNAIQFTKGEDYALSFENYAGINFNEGDFKSLADIKRFIKKEYKKMCGEV